MGAVWSGIWGQEEASSTETGLGDLPELCAAAVLINLDPTEICQLAKLNRVFRGAASADFVWEKKLPENFRYLMEFVSDEKGRRGRRVRRKDIYARLCQPITLDGGNKEFWLEKTKGGCCMAIAAKSLIITGIDDRRYWSHIPTNESRFQSVAYLQQIWWFEVVGETEFCFPAGTYSLYFRLHLGRPSRRFGRRINSTDHIHGWDVKPVRFQLSTSDGQHALTQVYLDRPGAWTMYKVGDFVVKDSGKPVKVKFSVAQIDCTHTKGGLCVDSAFIYPKGFFTEEYRKVKS
ncbi:hypothetical protein LUZ60_014684 [Juncus effusus]|nr:hypothetical protein LUZ60_014684 [Juncus effusus]